jgi:serine/threonine-protein kinase HipA
MVPNEIYISDDFIGNLYWNANKGLPKFQYDPAFIEKGIQPSPLVMPLRASSYKFPSLASLTFNGLPGLIFDSLPDKFGNKIVDLWLEAKGKEWANLHPFDRLMLVGDNSMGAIEIYPSYFFSVNSKKIEIENLVEALSNIRSLEPNKIQLANQITLDDVLQCSGAIGGSRPKAIVGWNPSEKQFHIGRKYPGTYFEEWIIKFDGLEKKHNKEDTGLSDFGKIEYAYYQMAVDAGIEMTHCRLHQENGRSHFMTKRFDREIDGTKIHMQSLCAIAHFDFNCPSTYSYEQAIKVMKKLKLQEEDFDQFILRAIFNVLGCNNDDHVKNIAYLMDNQGNWRLSPAYDITYAYDPKNDWISQHQMSINRKRENFLKEDFISLAKEGGISISRVKDMLDRVESSLSQWPEIAHGVGMRESDIYQVDATLRTMKLD